MKQHIILTVCVALFFTAPMAANAQIIEHLEYAAEVMQTNLGDAPMRGGLVYVKRCDQCATEGVSFSGSTQYFHRKVRINAIRAMELNGEGATIFFDPKSKYVTRVVFWSKTNES